MPSPLKMAVTVHPDRAATSWRWRIWFSARPGQQDRACPVRCGRAGPLARTGNAACCPAVAVRLDRPAM